ncbi:hypothetical protein N7466_001183 [Penicillium verhagenii]|uniref:uncharacterized protein n=1 Tax=Penicillium verhagenii TaxID=1562060 RepID=UPI0025450DB3|nr:uncharacterized protein N7466_001183 [Penicillium verhagenii]KAJ5948168.1 hypothetical protein N7466_001183 [Penicillium verhagenii]
MSSRPTQEMDTTQDQAENTALPGSTASNSKAKEASTSTMHFTSRNPPWTYLKLQLIPQPGSTATQPLDELSARTYLSAALSQFLGLTGTAIPIDILKTEPASPTAEKYDMAWIRVPREDGASVVAALSSWVGSFGSITLAWRVCAKGNYLGALVAGSGRNLFVP